MMSKKLVVLAILVFPIFLSANSNSFISIPNTNSKMKRFLEVGYSNLSFHQKNSFKFSEGECSIFYSSFNENFKSYGYLYLTFSKKYKYYFLPYSMVGGGGNKITISGKYSIPVYASYIISSFREEIGVGYFFIKSKKYENNKFTFYLNIPGGILPIIWTEQDCGNSINFGCVLNPSLFLLINRTVITFNTLISASYPCKGGKLNYLLAPSFHIGYAF